MRSTVQANFQFNEIKSAGFFTKDIQTMNDLFVHILRDIYYAEQRSLQALPTMIEKTTPATVRYSPGLVG